MKKLTKVLVTGGAGLIGSHLVDYLIAKGHSVVAVDNLEGGKREYVNPEADFWTVDLRHRTSTQLMIDDVKPKVVYHLAAFAAEGASVFNPLYTVESNLIGFLNLFVALLNRGFETFVFTSSMAAYGDQYPDWRTLSHHKYAWKGFSEDMARLPVDPYGLTKADIERYLEIYSTEFGFNYIIFRPHNVYGPHQSLTNPYRNVFGIWMNRIMHGEPPVIYGDGTQTRAFTYIDDCTPIIATSAWNKQAYGRIFNIGSEEVASLNKACQVVMDAMGYEGKPVYAPARPLEVKHAYCSSDEANLVFGYEAKTRLEEGVGKMAEWAKKVGPQPFHYWENEFEIRKKVPKVWREKKL